MQSNPTVSFWKTGLAMEPLTQILDLILMTKHLSQLIERCEGIKENEGTYEHPQNLQYLADT